MDRRRFLKATAATSGLALFGGLARTTAAHAADGPYGRLAPPDANGVSLPAGFRSRVIAVTGRPVATTGHVWHANPDGGATFARPDGGWIYVSNSETARPDGGVSMVRFDRRGEIIGAAPILGGSHRNCAGGATPWGSWLSCEEHREGVVWECDPTGAEPPAIRHALGVFDHEAAACDPDRRVIYLTEDKGDGALYRFVPAVWGDLGAGSLDVLTGPPDRLDWTPLPDPSAGSTPTRDQVSGAVRFDGGEGAWYDDGHLYFTTKGDNRVWRYTEANRSLRTIYDAGSQSDPVLRGVDNVTVAPSGDVYVCEDGDDMQVVMLMPEGLVVPFLQIPVDGSELTGVAFDPSGTRMYVSSQRNPGVTFEISGPFRRRAAPAGIDPVALFAKELAKRKLERGTSR